MRHICSTCGASFSRPSRLVIHQRVHTGERPYKCRCGRSYIRQQHLARHTNKCSGWPNTAQKNDNSLKSINASYLCSKCGAGPFSKKKSVWAHISIVHGERRFKCDKCSAAFPTKSKLERHQRRHHDLKCQTCIAISTSTATADILPNFDQRFDNFNDLRKHIAKHHPRPKIICMTCNQQFSRISQLRQHKLSHKPVEERRTFVCTQCSSGATATKLVAFTSNRGLLAHFRSLHASELRRFPCTYPSCPAILSTKQKLKVHLQRHTKLSKSEVVRVFQRASIYRGRLTDSPSPTPTPTTNSGGNLAVRATTSVKRRRCVPLRDLQEAWEVDSESSVRALLY